MRMKGSWHRYRPGEPWRLPARRAVCVLETDAAVAVCFDAPVVELLTDAELRPPWRAARARPGPAGGVAGLDEAVRRLRDRDAMALGEALLDQRAAAGIGNVIKSRGRCFMEGLDPWAPVGAFSDDELLHVVAPRRRAAGRQHRRRAPRHNRSPLPG